MASTVGFVPGTIIRWRKRCFVVVDCDGMDTIIVQEHGKGGFERIPVRCVFRRCEWSIPARCEWSFRPCE
jgi:hypothetical protein